MSAPDGPGFDPAFLSFPVPLPVPHKAIADDLARTSSGGTVLDYQHFSLAMSRSRRLARWVAWNIDGATRHTDIPRRGQKFRADPRLPASGQVLDEVYDRNRLDRGHLARRADLLWGDRAAAERANSDSFYFTNITPQMDDFNQAQRSGVWGRLEIALLEVVDRQRASVLAGPVLSGRDPTYRDVAVPLEFWKLLAYEIDGQPRARIFLVTQKLQLGVLPDPLAPFEVFAITPAELSRRTALSLSRSLRSKVVREPALAGSTRASAGPSRTSPRSTGDLNPPPDSAGAGLGCSSENRPPPRCRRNGSGRVRAGSSDGATGAAEAIGILPSGGFVVLDIALDDDLRSEGIVRDLVRVVQQARKDAGLDVSDRVALTVAADDAVWSAAEARSGYLSGETLAVSVTRAPPPPPRRRAEGERHRHPSLSLSLWADISHP